MRTILHTTIGQHTAYIIHRVMKEKKCKKSEALDHIIAEYERCKGDEHVDEVAERVIRKLRGGK
ncbi:MAG: hypothetical protein CI953_899 [Methanohalophilus sp.]|nr:MAG: hypothetical protein CI953_899 [Methanohalophilus sp.]